MLVDRNTLATRQKAVEAEIARCVSEAKKLFELDLSKVTISYNLTGNAAGWAFSRWGQFGIKLNRQFIAGTEESYEHLLNETISHEFSHIICYMNPVLGHKHDAGWKAVHRKMGGQGKRCHNVDVAAVKGGYDYLSDTGHVITLSSGRHNKVQRGQTYRFKHGKGTISKACPMMVRRPGQPEPTKADFIAKGHNVPGKVQWGMRQPVDNDRTRFQLFGTKTGLLAALGLTEHVAPPVTRPAQVPAPTTRAYVPPMQVHANKQMSKAEQVRDMIRAAKQIGSTQTDVIGNVMITLGMPKGQAYRYVTENWNRA